SYDWSEAARSLSESARAFHQPPSDRTQPSLLSREGSAQAVLPPRGVNPATWAPTFAGQYRGRTSPDAKTAEEDSKVKTEAEVKTDALEPEVKTEDKEEGDVIDLGPFSEDADMMEDDSFDLNLAFSPAPTTAILVRARRLLRTTLLHTIDLHPQPNVNGDEEAAKPSHVNDALDETQQQSLPPARLGYHPVRLGDRIVISTGVLASAEFLARTGHSEVPEARALMDQWASEGQQDSRSRKSTKEQKKAEKRARNLERRAVNRAKKSEASGSTFAQEEAMEGLQLLDEAPVDLAQTVSVEQATPSSASTKIVSPTEDHNRAAEAETDEETKIMGVVGPSPSDVNL
ncbi:MAG: hypothetical protein Q9218_007879, partial [Villophora microphyllina]